MLKKIKIIFSIIGFFTFAFFLLTFTACNTTEPDDNGKINPADTTTQNFTFETYEFGDGFESSYFNDVWIFDKNNIWAVGDVNKTSTTGRTNIVRWDGERWFGFLDELTSSGLTGIWALDTSNIYFASGAVRKYENNAIKIIDLTQLTFSEGQGVHKLWGSSENNIYGVGPWGTIVHFDGSAWTKIEFDTQWKFDDITGDKETGIAYATAKNQQFNTIIVSISTSSANIIYKSIDKEMNLTSSTLSMIGKEIYLARTKIWKFNVENKEIVLLDDLPPGYGIHAIAINNLNDIYFYGDKVQEGEKMVHFNGVRFKEFNLGTSNTTIFGGAYAIKNLSVMGAFSNNKAYLIKVERR